MPPKKPDLPQGVLDLLIDHAHGRIDRRLFLERAQTYALGGLTGAALLEMLTPDAAWAEQISASDPRVRSQTVTIASPEGNGAIKGLLVSPAKPGRYPVVLVIHDYRGLSPYIQDVARRVAVEGYHRPGRGRADLSGRLSWQLRGRRQDVLHG